jgi:hypothetical protein
LIDDSHAGQRYRIPWCSGHLGLDILAAGGSFFGAEEKRIFCWFLFTAGTRDNQQENYEKMPRTNDRKPAATRLRVRRHGIRADSGSNRETK